MISVWYILLEHHRQTVRMPRSFDVESLIGDDRNNDIKTTDSVWFYDKCHEASASSAQLLNQASLTITYRMFGFAVWYTVYCVNIGSHVTNRGRMVFYAGLNLTGFHEQMRINQQLGANKTDRCWDNDKCYTNRWVKSQKRIAVQHHRYRKSQCRKLIRYQHRYLLPGKGDFPTFITAEAGTRFSDFGGMQGWVDLGHIPR